MIAGAVALDSEQVCSRFRGVPDGEVDKESGNPDLRDDFESLSLQDRAN